jgi:UDP-2,3-diacylglucosamine pyrophosphatase LpxH
MTDNQYQVYYRFGNRDHLVKNGETVCSVQVREPDEDELKPIEELTDRELLLLTGNSSNLCTYCRGFASRNGVFDHVSDGNPPVFHCPECGEPAGRVYRVMGVGQVKHEDGTSHTFDFSIFEQWRRGEDATEETPSVKTREEPQRDEDFAVYSRKQWKKITDAIETDDESLTALLRRPHDNPEADAERFAVLTEEEYLRITEAVETTDKRVESLLRRPYLDRLD